jgi:hypothetical protein
MKGRTLLAALLACAAFGPLRARADEGGVPAENRPEGWNAWLTLAVPLDAKK